ncbi:Uncharacterised protein r2_g410 [Pycnogonum litorale]
MVDKEFKCVVDSLRQRELSTEYVWKDGRRFELRLGKMGNCEKRVKNAWITQTYRYTGDHRTKADGSKWWIEDRTCSVGLGQSPRDQIYVQWEDHTYEVRLKSNGTVVTNNLFQFQTTN